jgi:hypothetical protein
MKGRDVSHSSPEAWLCVLYAMNPMIKAVGELGVMKNNGAKNLRDRGGNGCWAVAVGSLREEQKPMVTHVMGGGLPQVCYDCAGKYLVSVVMTTRAKK